jgi:hypothetical protein
VIAERRRTAADRMRRSAIAAVLCGAPADVGGDGDLAELVFGDEWIGKRWRGEIETSADGRMEDACLLPSGEGEGLGSRSYASGWAMCQRQMIVGTLWPLLLARPNLTHNISV